MELAEIQTVDTVAAHLKALAAATPDPLELCWDTEGFAAALTGLAAQAAGTAS
jgi:hypothetical protein